MSQSRNTRNTGKYTSFYEDIEDEKLEETLKVALDVRKFEIELYWKRATYFWAFIAASFTAYVASLTILNKYILLDILIGCMGLVFSSIWYLVNKGSKYWQENWEKHVSELEDKIIGPLFKLLVKGRQSKFDIFKPLKPQRYSVSKLNQMLSLYVVFIWIILIGSSLYNLIICNQLFYIILGFVIIVLTFIFLIITANSCLSIVSDNENTNNSTNGIEWFKNKY